MTEERWTQLVRRLDRVAAEKPRAYRARVGLLAAAGYGYVLAIVTLALAGVAAFIAVGLTTTPIIIKFGWPLLVFAWVVLRALWIRIPEPEGLELSRSDAPALWALVDRVGKELDAPKVDRILLDDELNAGVVQTPRFGPVGPQRNHLTVGLPLMQALSEDQFTAVIAHELGHLSGNHSRFRGWIYRLRRTYAQLLEALEARESVAIGLFRRFFEWYSPYFGAYSFALARQDEYVADEAAKDVAGVGPAAGALVRIDLTDRWLSRRYWPEVFERVEQQAEAPQTAFTGLRERLPLREAGADADVEAALAEPTGLADTHPSLADRLKALGVDAGMARELAGEPPARPAAAALLGEREADLAAHFDAAWRESVQPAWEERHADAAEARSCYAALCETPPADFDERFELALLTYRFDGLEAALPLLRAAAQERPDSAPARYNLGCALLAEGDDAGLAHLDAAMERDPDAIIPACEAAIEFLLAHERKEEAERYLERGRERASLLEAAEKERGQVLPDDVLEVHDLPDEVVGRARLAAARQLQVGGAFLAGKAVVHLEDELGRAHVMGLDLERGVSDQERADTVQRVADEIGLPSLLVFPLDGDNRWLRKKLAKVPGAEVYRRLSTGGARVYPRADGTRRHSGGPGVPGVRARARPRGGGVAGRHGRAPRGAAGHAARLGGRGSVAPGCGRRAAALRRELERRGG
ncbi:MAG TPA: M48 family metallopeptidase [Solirubrobacteraceae bacterium]|jgi:Zn-dependent protease with chaperone function